MPDIPEQPSVARELEQHCSSLRRLAKDLVGRDADDLVQDTAVRALRSPPPAQGGLFAWLATVMRNVACNRRRDGVRRQRREAANGPAGELAPSAADDAIHRDCVRAVTDELWSLPEPYQQTLVQRYFQDLSPTQIAERTATPLPTVKSRLQRGLDLLRTGLARRDGRDWRAALVPAFGLSFPSLWSLPVLSVSSMSTLLKSALVLVAGAMAALSWWGLVQPLDPVVSKAPKEPLATASTLPVAGVPTTAADREVMSGAVPALANALEQPFAFELRCRVHDANGMRIGGAQIAVAPPACALALWPQATDGQGEVVLSWRGKVPTMTMALGLVHGNQRTALQQITVTAGLEASLTLVAGAAPLPASARVDELGRQIVTMPECSQGNAACGACHQGMPAPDMFAIRGQWRQGLHPDAFFGDRLAAAPPPSSVAEAAFDSNQWHSMVGVGGLLATGSVVTECVFGADGKPAPGARVEIHRPNFFGGGTHTKADGTFRFPWPTGGDGPATVRAGGGPEGFATTTIEVVGDRANHVDLILETGPTLRGQVIGHGGKSMNGARIEYVAGPGLDGDLATVGPDGRFAFANLPAGAGTLLVWGVHGEKLPVAEERLVVPGGEVVLDLRSGAGITGSVRLFVRAHDGEPPNDVEVRIWQVQTGRGAFLDRLETGGFHAHGLAAGFYRLEVGAIATGFRDLGPQWVDGSGPVELGTVQLSPPGRVHIEALAEGPEFELYARRADLDVRACDIMPWTRDVDLPPGRWLLLCNRGGKRIARDFELTAGASSTVSLVR
ncbi:MAG: sigma-70 family RNA polymerase sigma factor [Planctomycetota bacterium]